MCWCDHTDGRVLVNHHDAAASTATEGRAGYPSPDELRGRAMSFRPDAVRGAQPAGPGAIDYRLIRRSIMSEYRKGRLAQHEVCDAHPELLRAAVHAGRPAQEQCPICEEADLVLVTYAFGPRLPAHGRCITTQTELAKLARGVAELACYVVEVCPECRWNPRARTYLLGRAHAH